MMNSISSSPVLTHFSTHNRHAALMSAVVTCHHFAIMQGELLKCSIASRDFLVYTPHKTLLAPQERHVGTQKPVHR